MIFVRDFPELERLPVVASPELFRGPSFWQAKLRRMRLKWNELPRYLRGLRVCRKRKIAIERAEFRHGAGIV